MVYTGEVPPSKSKSESSMQKIAVRIVPDSAFMQLDPMARPHYSRLYTIEHNLKVGPHYGELCFARAAHESIPSS